MSKKMQKLTIAVVRLPLRNVTRNRNCRPADLVGQTVNFFLGKTLSGVIHSIDEIHSFLPSDQILEMLRHGHQAYNVDWVLGTRYSVLLTPNAGCASRRHPARCNLCPQGAVYLWLGRWLPSRLRAVGPSGWFRLE